MDKGFVIMAQNTNKVDYVKCAQILKKSILSVMPESNVTIITELPYGDLAPDSDWKLINDWQVYEASPYEYTIKLEADMIIPSNIDYYWEVLKDRDLVVSSNIRNYKNQISDVKFYRQFIVDNKLPDVYNAITYWRLSKTAKDFFDLVKNIFEQWESYRTLLKFPDEVPTTDVVYAIAAMILGPEEVTLPKGLGPTIVHMKRYINPIQTDDWTKELVWETNPFRINTVAQFGLVHYHIKEWRSE